MCNILFPSKSDNIKTFIPLLATTKAKPTQEVLNFSPHGGLLLNVKLNSEHY